MSILLVFPVLYKSTTCAVKMNENCPKVGKCSVDLLIRLTANAHPFQWTHDPCARGIYSTH